MSNSKPDARDAVARRKDHHLDLCLEKPVGSTGPSVGLDGYAIEYDALPELDLDEVDLSTTLLGHTLKAPIVIGAMTGGTVWAGQLNARLARAASRVGVAMALGSQRAMLVDPTCTPTFDVRHHAPDLPLLFGNIGAVQLNYGVDAEAIVGLIEAVRADALYVHLNPLQEAIQPEGDTRFAGLHSKLEATLPSLGVPALVKEVGAGISPTTARKLAALPLAGIEVAGVGGTSWARVESYRADAGSSRAQIGARLSGFGISTSESIVACREALGQRVVIGSGGIRTGMDAAVALALGADAIALARPMLEAAVAGEDAVVDALQTLIDELRILCFLSGARTPAELREKRLFRPSITS